MRNGFVKVAAASPVIKVADAEYNAQRIIETIKKADDEGVKLIVFPELSLTGCCLYDLVGHKVILEGAKKALCKVIEATEETDILAFVGLPYAVGSRLYSVAAAIYNGELLGFVPRENVENSRFAEPGIDEIEVNICGKYFCALAGDTLFTHVTVPGLIVAAELGGDMSSIVPPAARHAAAGATVIAQLASFPETVYSTDDTVLDIRYESRHYCAAMVLAAPGKGESTTDNVFSGLCLVAENGKVLAQSESDDSYAVSEIDVEYLTHLRRATSDFDCCGDGYSSVEWGAEPVETALTRSFPMLPHMPENKADWPAYCERMLDIQVSGLAKRMAYAHLTHCVIGISGGVDSTLAVMICALAVKKLGLPATNVVACTLPCFGTSSRTKSNAVVVAENLGADVRIIDIGKSVYQHFDDIGHAHDDYSIAYENAQARERTQILMDIANKVNGLDVGTEDLSEFIDGWCTYNGDHTSMYDVNLGLTKTQVRENVRYIAGNIESVLEGVYVDRAELYRALMDVLDCPVTPELLPIHEDKIEQKSEDSVGSYSLQDFFTHKMLICGFDPKKTLRLAKLAYSKEALGEAGFTDEELLHWLTSYCKRLFSQQFKRSCLMDGPAVEAFTVSPRTGFLIPSDAEAAMFLQALEDEE